MGSDTFSLMRDGIEIWSIFVEDLGGGDKTSYGYNLTLVIAGSYRFNMMNAHVDVTVIEKSELVSWTSWVSVIVFIVIPGGLFAYQSLANRFSI